MTAGAGDGFTVDRVPQVTERIRELAEVARTKGLLPRYLRNLESILEKMEQSPLEWGNLLYHPQAPRSTVCHGAVDFLYVRYVVFEAERVVIILELKAMANTELDIGSS